MKLFRVFKRFQGKYHPSSKVSKMIALGQLNETIDHSGLRLYADGMGSYQFIYVYV